MNLAEGYWHTDSLYVRNPGGRKIVWQGREAPLLVVAAHDGICRQWGIFLACGDHLSARQIKRLDVRVPDDRYAAQEMADGISEALAALAALEQER